MKHLLSKNKVYEFFNPYLDGTVSAGTPNTNPGVFAPNDIIAPSGLNHMQDIDMLDKPAWLDTDDTTVWKHGDAQSIGTFFINGEPISSWGAMRGGSLTGSFKKHMLQNWYNITNNVLGMFPNGLKAQIQDSEEFYQIEELKIIQMIPNSNGIGFHMNIQFRLTHQEDEIDTIIFARIENIGPNMQHKFICQELDGLSKKQYIAIIGKIWVAINNFFEVPCGIYTCKNKEVITYSELGQIKVIEQNNIIEVLFVDDNKIKFSFNNTIYYIKGPSYYWFNWYFQKN